METHSGLLSTVVLETSTFPYQPKHEINRNLRKAYLNRINSRQNKQHKLLLIPTRFIHKDWVIAPIMNESCALIFRLLSFGSLSMLVSPVPRSSHETIRRDLLKYQFRKHLFYSWDYTLEVKAVVFLNETLDCVIRVVCDSDSLSTDCLIDLWRKTQKWNDFLLRDYFEEKWKISSMRRRPCSDDIVFDVVKRWFSITISVKFKIYFGKWVIFS